MIPVHIKKPGDLQPPSTTHYVVARNGLFLAKKEWWIDAVVPVKRINVLDNQEVSARLLMPTLPAMVFTKALKVARRVYETSQSEVCLMLHYHKESGYQLTVPIQDISAGHVKYEASERLPGHLSIGTIHSHGGLTAFHSSTDHRDEIHWDGIHVTVGDMQYYPEFSLSAEMVVNGHRFPADFSWFENLQGPTELGLYLLNSAQADQWEIPEEWLARVAQPGKLKLYPFKGGK